MKKKIILFLCIIIMCNLLLSINLITENVGNKCVVVIKNKVSDLQKKGDFYSYSLIMEIYDKDGENLLASKHKNITLDDHDVKEQDVVINFFETSLLEGKYRAYVKIKGKNRNYKHQEIIDFSVESEKQYSNIFLTKRVKKAEIEINDWQQIFRNNNCYLYQWYKEKPTNILLVSEKAPEKKEINLLLPDSKMIQYKLTPDLLINKANKYYIRVVDKGGNIDIYKSNSQYVERFDQKYSYKDQWYQIKYILSHSKWKKIDKEDVNYKEKVFLFWNNQKGAKLLQQVLHERVIIADQRYTVFKTRPGWKSDRGRIYIKFGEPDEIENIERQRDGYYYLIWHYYKQQRKFIFLDRIGTGDFQLRNKGEEYDF